MLFPDDTMVYQDGRVYPFYDSMLDSHSLFIFFPKAFTPVCQSELGALQDWLPRFTELGVSVYAATTDSLKNVEEWFKTESSLRDARYPVLVSKSLLRTFNVAPRSSVFVMTNGDICRIDHFDKVGRSLSELHRQAYAYTTGQYCGHGWKDPSDNLTKDANEKV